MVLSRPLPPRGRARGGSGGPGHARRAAFVSGRTSTARRAGTAWRSQNSRRSRGQSGPSTPLGQQPNLGSSETLSGCLSHFPTFFRWEVAGLCRAEEAGPPYQWASSCFYRPAPAYLKFLQAASLLRLPAFDSLFCIRIYACPKLCFEADERLFRWVLYSALMLF